MENGNMRFNQIIIANDMIETFSEVLADRLEGVQSGDPLDKETQMMGNIINEKEIQQIDR